MMDSNKLFTRASDEQRDRIYDIIDRLPSQFFGGHGDWVGAIKELYAIIKQVEEGDG